MPEAAQTTKESFRAELDRLVRNFAANEAELTSPGYTEMQARTHFITPFFRALGWDVENRAGKPYRGMEVLEEKGPGEGRPDYTFRIGGIAKFFVEAKAPHEHLDNERHILQVKRYAWSTKEVFAAVLTDFEEFRFYDASQEPDPKHAERGLIFDFRYTHYLQNLDKLWEFSRERVAAGSIEALLPRDKLSLRFRKPPDEKFLEDMTRWRLELARAVFKRNSHLDARTLTEMVQRLLDRLIFIRVAEDRQILPSRTLWERVQEWKAIGGRKPLLPMLNELFHQINQDFNGDIFKPHSCEEIQLHDWALGDLIEQLYPPRGPYRFDAIPVDIFGSVYERYLGKTVHVRGKDVRDEEKPEVRKAGGVYYTPKYIVDYIVKNTVGKVIEGKTPKEIEKIRILDPACGSGSFLIGAFQCLIDYHLDYYEKHPKEARLHPMFPEAILAGNGLPRLSIWRKAKILRHNLYGVDIDPQAVEITMMNLYLKALEGEREVPRNKAVLPELKYNIRCGNSLIAPDIAQQQPASQQDTRVAPASRRWLSPEELARLNPFDWHSKTDGFGDIVAPAEGPERKSRGFDAVIGNPPYKIVFEEAEKAYLYGKYESFKRCNELYAVFIEKGLGLLHDGAFFSMIVPNTYLLGPYFDVLKKHILSQALVREIVDFGTGEVFEDSNVFTSVLVLQQEADVSRLKPEKALLIDAIPMNGSFTRASVLERTQRDLQDLIWKPRNPLTNSLMRKYPPLAEFCEVKDVGLNYWSIGRGKKRGGSIADRVIYKGRRKNRKDIRFLKGSDIERYEYKFGDHWLRHDYQKRLRPRVDILRFTPAFLEKPEKIIYRQTADRLIAALDTKKFYLDKTAHLIVFKDGTEPRFSLPFLLGFLNSKLFTFLYRDISKEQGRAFAQVKIFRVKQLPICIPRTAEQRRIAERLELLTTKMSRLAGDHSPSANSEKRRLDREIDELVYDLYGLTAAERRLVEAALAA